jgi:hypothetical protein
MQISRIRDSLDPRLVDSIDLMPGMHQPRGKLTVVSQQQKTLRVVVKAAHGIDVLSGSRDQIENSGAPFRIGPGRDNAARLVQKEIDPAWGGDSTTIDADVV